MKEKIAQLFMISLEVLVTGYTEATAAGEATKKAMDQYPVSGLIYRAGKYACRKDGL